MWKGLGRFPGAGGWTWERTPTVGLGMTQATVVQVGREGAVVTITLDSPAKRNALSATLLGQLAEALDAAAADPTVRAVVLTGAGTVFCAGADLDDPPRTTPGERFGLPAVLRSIVECPKPVIARVNGHVRAGGLGLVAACDIAVAPFDATFAFTEVRLGLVPAIVAVFCQPLMQPRAFAHYTLTGVPFDAAEAVQHGLVTLAVDRTRLETMIAEILDQLLLAAPAAVARTKALLGELPTVDLDEGLALTSAITATQFQSDDAVEGIAAFRDKRLPAWARPRG